MGREWRKERVKQKQDNIDSLYANSKHFKIFNPNISSFAEESF